MKFFINTLLCFCCVFVSFAQSDPVFSGETITFKASDGISVTADLYMPHKATAPFIILYHQAGYSRGEYRSIAPQLNEMGFNCMAVDQRSGDKVNGVINETHKGAVASKLPTEYLDATGLSYDCLPYYNMTFIEDINDVVQNNPVREKDRAVYSMLQSIGIKELSVVCVILAFAFCGGFVGGIDAGHDAK